MGLFFDSLYYCIEFVLLFGDCLVVVIDGMFERNVVIFDFLVVV